ncbi:hypothetical protein [Terrabacter sp. BE26]|uniref:hypothetical protein n=1 Tax=Terrabacter sp. BE26 TaxID=2898152 RepID=UPI0035BE8BC7
MDEPAHTPERFPEPEPDPELEPEFDPELDPAELDARHGAASDSDQEPDAGPGTDLDPELDRHVRALLADAPEAGPMPAEVSRRISTALLEEARLRVDPGPLATVRSKQGRHGADGRRADTGGDLLQLPSAPSRRRPAYLIAAVAAAAAVVAVGASALHVTKRPNGAAALGGGYPSGAPATSPAAPTPAPGNGGLHIQLSRTAYTSSGLAAQARTLLNHPGPSIGELAAESPAIGPIATSIGLESCLEAIGAVDATRPAPDTVSADLATFDGRPAAVVVVTRSGTSTAWAVERSCTTGAPGILAGATHVP